jgi:hypothetical protein
MIKNKNIFITLQIEKNHQTNTLVLNIHFDSTAPNFSIENEIMHWNPTPDELDFISEVFERITGHTNQRTTTKEPEPTQPFIDTTTDQQPHHLSEMGISTPSDSVIEIAIDPDETQHLKKTELDEKIFIQADEKKIDEIIKRKKSGFSEEYVIESGDKSRIDRMLKQKKKKE